MRTKKTIINSIVALTINFISIIVGFIAQKIFVLILNAEYLGINGLFSNILSILSIAELGIGEAIIFHLYQPVANNKKEEIKSLLQLYKKAYNIIAFLVLLFGLCIIPFLNFFIGNTSLNLNFTLIYIIFLLQTVISYILTYKRSILFANQENYIINIIHGIYIISMNISQLIILYLTRNYYIYLTIKIIFILLENIIITTFANRKYPYIKEKKVKKLDKKIEKDIFRRTRAQLFHRIGGIVVIATDNIIISKFIGILAVGLYSNYYLVINSIKILFTQLISSNTASVGNLLIENNNLKSYNVYKRIRFANFWITTYSAISIFLIIQPFVTIWLGTKYLLPEFVLIILTINFYQNMMRATNDLFMNAAGICIENRFVPLFESLINIVASIICLKIFGLAGVFMGTIISGFALWCYSYPKFVYKNLLKRKYKDYIKETFGYIALFFVIWIITYSLSTIIHIENAFINLIANFILCLILPNTLLFIIFRKTDNFKYYKNLLSNIFNKIFREKRTKAL